MTFVDWMLIIAVAASVLCLGAKFWYHPMTHDRMGPDVRRKGFVLASLAAGGVVWVWYYSYRYCSIALAPWAEGQYFALQTFTTTGYGHALGLTGTPFHSLASEAMLWGPIIFGLLIAAMYSLVTSNDDRAHADTIRRA